MRKTKHKTGNPYTASEWRWRLQCKHEPEAVIAQITRVPVGDVPQFRHAADVAATLLEYAIRRYDTFGEVLTPLCWLWSLRFLADEPDAVAVIEQSINNGGKVFKQFFPVAGDTTYPERPRRIRYAMRTSRKLRSEPLHYVETVLKPRTTVYAESAPIPTVTIVQPDLFTNQTVKP
ncbi:MAG: hypothetical protein JNL32_00065 [Candidatus Kapabacteria bacterium]|nr:hypothetical protein [Candidatus Kapabacteria bacterium]